MRNDNSLAIQVLDAAVDLGREAFRSPTCRGIALAAAVLVAINEVGDRAKKFGEDLSDSLSGSKKPAAEKTYPTNESPDFYKGQADNFDFLKSN